MNTHISNAPKNKNLHSTSKVSQKQNINNATFQFVDNRPEAIMQKKMQAMVNNQNGKPIQKQELEDEELLQGKFCPVQKQEIEEEELLQGKFEPIQKKENNTGLPDNLKTGIENLSGYSMDDVKVHRNSDKPGKLQAHAYAQGTDIHLGPGQEKHLPHEVWHVVQQKQGRVKPTMQMKGSINVNNDVGLEKEADAMGNKALQMKNNETQGFGFVDNRSEAFAQRKVLDALSIGNQQKTTTSIGVLIQRVPRFKIFENEGEKPTVGEGLTKLGVRRAELQIDSGDIVRGQIGDTPQGMSVSDSYEEEEGRRKGKSSEGIFQIDSSKFQKDLKVRTDPDAASHYLVGPKNKLKYDKLHHKIGESRNKWKKVGEVNTASGDWEEVHSQNVDKGRNEQGEISWKKERKDKRFERTNYGSNN